MRTVLPSIKPEYADRILEGTKEFEFRRLSFASPVDEVFIYATSPTKKIIGYFRTHSIHEGSPRSLWIRCSANAGIAKAKYFRYFGQVKRAFAIQVRSAKRFATHVDPKSVWPGFLPPQSFRYLEKADADFLKDLGSKALLNRART